MRTISILEDHDILKMSDWCRPLNFTTMSGGHSDDYTFEIFGRPTNNARWCKVSEILPAWTDKPISKLPDILGDYEFIRGDIPMFHKHRKY